MRLTIADGDWEEEAPGWPWWDIEGEAYRLLFAHLCEQDGCHDWYLEIHPGDGVTLSCRKCPVRLNDAYPDGGDLLTGEFEVYPGYVLSLYTGGVQLNGQETYGLFTYGWRGPVTVELHTEKHYSWEYGAYEYDAWIEVVKRDP